MNAKSVKRHRNLDDAKKSVFSDLGGFHTQPNLLQMSRNNIFYLLIGGEERCIFNEC
jgi:hypothetical protein